MSKAIFELRGVYFSYLERFPALCGVDIAIEQGQKIAVIGANGSGKSTLLHILDGLIFANKGSVKFKGQELKENDFNNEGFSRDFRRSVGFVFQNPEVQLFCPTVREDILFGPLQLELNKEDVNKRFDELVTILDIKDLLDRSPHQLSIGEKRKVAIASSLIINPDILILDEPTAGLDPLTSRHIIDIILEANINGKTIVTATHDLHIVAEISDVIYVFDRNKKISRYGDPVEILSDESFLKDSNLVHIHSHKHKDKIHAHPHLHLDHH
jgi:cobalt/nickel transport system ATP-binding protein